MIHITQASVDTLAAAVNECDGLILQVDRHNDEQRSQHRMPDGLRLQQHRTMRMALIEHRNKLQALYIAIAGKDPWKDIPV